MHNYHHHGLGEDSQGRSDPEKNHSELVMVVPNGKTEKPVILMWE